MRVIDPLALPTVPMVIFISYGRSDTLDFAKNLSSWLRNYGHEPWLDVEHGIPLGCPFDVRIEDGIQNSAFLIALLSSSSVRPGGFCRKELLYAQSCNKSIIPVRLSDVVPPIQIIDINYIDASKNPDIVFKLLPMALDSIKKDGKWQAISLDTVKKHWWESLHALDFKEELERHGSIYYGRRWLFDQIQSWISNENSKLLLLIADAGWGKSALSAQLTTYFDVKGIHFCSRSNIESCHPVIWIERLISQLALQFTPYRDILNQIPSPNWADPPESLFRTLVSDRLGAFKEKISGSDKWVCVIDGLDEAEAVSGSAMSDFLIETADRIPPWLRIIVTTRPDEVTKRRFKGDGIKQMPLNINDLDNLSDLNEYIKQRLQKTVNLGILPGECDLFSQIQKLSAGNFLYSKMVLDALIDTESDYRLSFAEVGNLPPKLGGLYDRMFRKRFPNPDTYEREIIPLLNCLSAAKAPLLQSFLITASGVELRMAQYGLRALSQFLIMSENRVQVFHQSVIQWLTEDPVSNSFAVNPEEGHNLLANACWKEYQSNTQEISAYSLFFLPFHLIATNRNSDLENLIKNPRYLEIVWDSDKYWIRTLWTKIEHDTPLRANKVYLDIIHSNSPSSESHAFRIADLLHYMGYLQESSDIWIYLADKYRKTENNDGLQKCLGNQAVILLTKGEPEKAIELLREQEQLCRKLDNINCLQKTLGNQAVILRNKGDFNTAVSLLREQERICKEIGNKDGLQAALGNQAVILMDLGDNEGALKLLKDQERICREIGNKDGLQAALGNQAVILMDLGDNEGALRLLTDQEHICRDLGNKNSLCLCLNHKAVILKNRGDFGGAMALFKEQERICRELGNFEGLGISLGDQAIILQARGDLDGAMALFKEQERICRELGNFEGLGISLGNQAIILQSRGDLDGAMALFKEQERIYREMGNSNGLSISLCNQARILQVRGDFDGAMALHKEEAGIWHELGNKGGLQVSLGNQAIILADRGDFDGAMALHKEQERICRELGNRGDLAIPLGKQAMILKDQGDLDGAIELLKEQEKICREQGNADVLANSLGDQAVIMRSRGDINRAMFLFKEEERICRELGNKGGVARSLGNQALTLQDLGDLNGAMVLIMKQEPIYRELENVYGLATSLTNKAIILLDMQRHREARSAAEEAFKIASSYGYTALAKQILSILERIQRG